MVILQHLSADDFLKSALQSLQKSEVSSNIVLAHAMDSKDGPDGAAFETSMQSKYAEEFWLTVWDPADSSQLSMVATCLRSDIGNYPLFLWASEEACRSKDVLQSRTGELVRYLLNCTVAERVFSSFGEANLVQEFAKQWTALTGFGREVTPYYVAVLSICTPQSFLDSSSSFGKEHRMRLASEEDLDAVTVMCKQFADTSVHFPLTLEDARTEARRLISRHQVWIYKVSQEVVAICAASRQTAKVACITKVYTLPSWRRNGFGERLIRYVTKWLLSSGQKDCVILYVGVHNSAQSVYDRVGFQGLCGKPRCEGVEDALEIGFANTEKGHW